jgi:hypothetical protein
MQMNDILAQTGGIQQMARELGVSQQQAQSGVSALLPAILGGMKKHAQAPTGVDGFGDLLGRMGGDSLLDNVVSPQPTDIGPGNNLLGHIFGSKDVSRTVAQSAADRSGLQPSILKKMLPMVAMMAAGYMAKQHGIGGRMGGGMLGRNPLGGGMGGGLGSMLDLNGNGNPLDDILRMAMRR